MNIEIKNLTKRYGAKTLFENLTLSISGPAVLWAPSGWGKTTLLRVLMGLEEAGEGEVGGIGRVGAVFQEDRLCPQLTAVQNISLVLPGPPESHAAVITAALGELGLDEAARAQAARRLSGGQKRRVALARAVLAQNDTLLLDEPFTGLDPAATARAAAFLNARLNGRGALLACHDREAIRALGWSVIDLEVPKKPRG